MGLLLPVNGKAQVKSPPPPLRITTSFYPMYIMALNVAGGIEGVTVQNMTRPTAGCLHDYQITPRDMVMLSKADVLIINGGGMESFIEKVYAACPRLKVIDAGRRLHLAGGVPLKDGNAHFWLSPSLAQQQVMILAAGLSSIDPGRAAFYLARAHDYSNRIEQLSRRMHERLDPFRGRSIVTFHEAFSYFADEFKLIVVDVVEREPGSAPSSREMGDTIRLVRSTKGAALFSEPQYPPEAIETIARETGRKVYLLDPLVTGPDTPDAYLTGMEHNAIQLEQAFK